MAFAQPATFDEVWSDDRVRSYLNKKAPAGENADFYALYNAYKHMRPSDFERFLVEFRAVGRDLSAPDAAGRTLLDILREHPQSQAFVQILANAS